MRYRSTLDAAPPVPFREAVLAGLAPDGGLYLPESLPLLPHAFWQALPEASLAAIGFAVTEQLAGGDLPRRVLRELLEEAYDFPAPLVRLDGGADRAGDGGASAPGGDFVLELFHGPTLAFKDFGARFLARCLAWFRRNEEREITILVATSGDTGSAVAHGFLGVAGTRVVLLYPRGKVSRIQEQQLTTMGGNVVAIEVEGAFDDCQRMVKATFADEDLRAAVPLTSANSISIARLVPQSFYAFHAYGQLLSRGAIEPGEPMLVCVPSGNFGNLTASLLAWRMGLPVEGFVAATNLNDVVPQYLRTGRYEPRPSVPTLSNAMDVGAPSNFDRLLDLFGHDHRAMEASIRGAAFTDEETVAAIAAVHRAHGYTLDPHGAVAWLGLREARAESGTVRPGVAYATAHPAKFGAAVEAATGAPVAVPARLAAVLEREKQAVPMAADPAALAAFLRGG